MNMATDPELPVHVKFVKLMPTTFELVFGAIFYGFLLVAVSAGVYSAIALHYAKGRIATLEHEQGEHMTRFRRHHERISQLESERYIIEVQGVEDWSEEVIKELGKRLKATSPNVFEEKAEIIKDVNGKVYRVVPDSNGLLLEELPQWNVKEIKPEELPTPEPEKET